MSGKSCGCCACLTGAAPKLAGFNRPGLSRIRYRAGTHAAFYDAMIRRLTVPPRTLPGSYSLHGLTTRETDDPAIALLDSWACVADVLTFYQERIANEGYLRTATERRSILELGRLVGYTLKPGVSSSVYLAYTLDEATRTTIPAGTKSQSIPGVNEQPQVFETSEDTEARGAWNALRPRLTRAQQITLNNVLVIESMWLKGIDTVVAKGDPILFVFTVTLHEDGRMIVGGEGGSPDRTMEFYALRRVASMKIDMENDRTEVLFERLRPYYRELFKQINIARVTPPDPINPAPPNPAPVSPATVVLKGTKGKKKKKSAATPVTPAASSMASSSGGSTFDPVLWRLFQQLLLGGDILWLQRVGSKLEQRQNVTAALAAEDDDEVAVPPPQEPSVAEFLEPLTRRRGLPPASQFGFGRSLLNTLAEGSDLVPRLISAFYPQLDTTIYTAIANHNAGAARWFAELHSVHVLRRRAAPFGYNAPTVMYEERGQGSPTPADILDEDDATLYLDNANESIATGSYVVVQRPHQNILVSSVRGVKHMPRTAYSVSGQTSRLLLRDTWWDPALSALQASATTPAKSVQVQNLETLRHTGLYVQSEELTLSQEPLDRPVGMPAPANDTESESRTRIKLDGIVHGLTPGRWVIVSGERADLKATSGVTGAELAMVANVEMEVDGGPRGKPYSILVLAPEGLAWQYKRSTVRIYGNVVKATHGETRTEILGAGDAAKPLQTFTLHHTPLTFTAAATPAGVVSTLAVRVNDVLWHETDSFAAASPTDRIYITRTADDGKVSVIFGNGREGARVPTGNDNIRAAYRSGIGKPGNVKAKQIATAVSRPLGVREVINPISASGGANRESRDDARRNIPVSLQAMGRVVSVRDFADFARTFAGISKASAIALTDGRRRIVHLTVGGTDDIAIETTSDLYRALVTALRTYGDPYTPFAVAQYQKLVIAGSARVNVHPDYLWTNVAPAIREALLETFAYERRELGQPVYPAEVIATIQNVPGVVYVDLDALGAVRASQLVDFSGDSEAKLPKIISVQPIVPGFARRKKKEIRPAQLACLPRELADLFILEELKHE